MPYESYHLATPEQLKDIQLYIERGWDTLERSLCDMLNAITDDKVFAEAGLKPVIYVSPKEHMDRVESHIRGATDPADFERIELRKLPQSWRDIMPHGLLYLPARYIVPGGSFNEMYGWDSYFIQRGLLANGKMDFARETVENLLYEVEMYGTVLNANRTYYLSRSQPPFLSAMVLMLYARTGDKGWLRRALPTVERYYKYWTEGPHAVTRFGLSRYYDFSEEPAPEVLVHERDAEGYTHYDRVKLYYRDHWDEVENYDPSLYYDPRTDRLTPLFFRADRSMRESGHDPSNRFGHFNIAVLDMLPVDLNCLVYRMEMDLAEIYSALDCVADSEAWKEKARIRAGRINELMWDEECGLYFDYNFKTERCRKYPYVTTFFPLWVAIASREQAARVMDNLNLFDRAGGLQTSVNVSGNQWDAPLGWAPMQLIAAEGMRRYGYDREADRVTINFLSMVLKEFIEHSVILEKYNVVERESRVHKHIKYGYSKNEVGFGWTNAAFVEMYAALPEQERDKVRRLTGVSG